MNKLKKLIFASIIFSIFICNSAFAYNFEPKLRKYLLKQEPNVEIRFDGLVTFPDGSRYLPVTPSVVENVAKVKIDYTYPNKKQLKERPEVIVFNNNYSLVKIIPLGDEKYTLCSYEDLPMSVKTGLLPQDMLVPSGLIVPDHIKGIMGDLVIPLVSEVGIGKKLVITAKKYSNIDKSVNDKLYLTTYFSSNLIRVFDAKTSKAVYTLNLNGMPRSIKPFYNERYLFVLLRGKDHIDIVDLKDESVARQLDLNVEPTEIVVDNSNNVAYVATKEENSIYKIDCKDVTLVEKIKITGVPENLTLSNDGNQLAYIDKNTSKLYCITIDENYRVDEFCDTSNVAKIIIKNDNLYLVSRTKNLLEKYKITKKAPTEEEHFLNEIRSGKTVEEYENEQKKAKKDAHRKAYGKRYQEGMVKIYHKRKSSLEEEDPNFYRAQFLKEVMVAPKSIDMIEYNNRLYILGAKENELYIVNADSFDVEMIIKLPINGFCNKISRLNNNSNIALITNVVEKNYLIFDLDKKKTIQKVPIDTNLSDIVIVEKSTNERL